MPEQYKALHVESISELETAVKSVSNDPDLIESLFRDKPDIDKVSVQDQKDVGDRVIHQEAKPDEGLVNPGLQHEVIEINDQPLPDMQHEGITADLAAKNPSDTILEALARARHRENTETN